MHEKILELREIDLDELQDMKSKEKVFKDLISICNSNPYLLHQADYNNQTPIALLFATTFTREIKSKVNKNTDVLVANPESKFRVALELMKCGASIEDVVSAPEAREFLRAISGRVDIMKHASWYNKNYHPITYITTSLAHGAQFIGCLQAGITQQFFTSCLLAKYSKWSSVEPIYRRLSLQKDYLPQEALAALDAAESFFAKEMKAFYNDWASSNASDFDKSWFWFKGRYGANYHTPEDFAFSIFKQRDTIRSSCFNAENLLFLNHYFYIEKKFSSDNGFNIKNLCQRFMVDRLKQIKIKRQEEVKEGRTFASGGYDLIRQTIVNRDILIKSLIEDSSYDFKGSNSNMKLEKGLIELAQENEISTPVIGLLRKELQPEKHHDELIGHVIVENLEAIENLKNIRDELKILSQENPNLRIKKLWTFTEDLKGFVNEIEGKLLETNASSAALEAINIYKTDMLPKCDKLSKDAALLKEKLNGNEEKSGYVATLTTFHPHLSIEGIVDLMKVVFGVAGKEPHRVKRNAYDVKDVLNRMRDAKDYASDVFKSGQKLSRFAIIYAARFVSTLEEVSALLEEPDLAKVSSDLEKTIKELNSLEGDFRDSENACKALQKRLITMFEGSGRNKGMKELSEEVETLTEKVIKSVNLRIAGIRKESVASLDSKLEAVRKEFLNSLVDEAANGVADIEHIAEERKKILLLELPKKVNDIEILGYKAMYPELKEEKLALPEVFQELGKRIQIISYAVNVLRGGDPYTVQLFSNDHKNKLIDYRAQKCADDLQHALVDFAENKMQRDRIINALAGDETKNIKPEEVLSLIQEISNVASKAMRVTAANSEKASYYLDLLKYSKAKELQDIRRKFGNQSPKLKHAIKFLNEAKHLSEERIPQLGVIDEDGKLIDGAGAEIRAVDKLKLEYYIMNNLVSLVRKVKLMGTAVRKLVEAFISIEEKLGAEDKDTKIKDAKEINAECRKEMIELNKKILDSVAEFTNYTDSNHPVDVINSIQEFLFNALKNVVATQNYAVKNASERIWMLKQGMISSTGSDSKTVMNRETSYIKLQEDAREISSKIDELNLVLGNFTASKEPTIKDVEEEQLPEELQSQRNEQLHKKEGKFDEHFLMEIKYYGELKGIKDRDQKDFKNQPVGILVNTLEDAQEKRRYVAESLNKFIETSINVKKLNGIEQGDAQKSVDSSYKSRVKLFGKNFTTTSKKLKNMEQKFQNLFKLQGVTTETSGIMVDIKNLKEQQKNLNSIYGSLKKIHQDNKTSISQIDENIKNAEALEQELLNAGMTGVEFKNVAYGHSDVIDDFGIIVKVNSIDKAIGILAKDIIRYVKHKCIHSI